VPVKDAKENPRGFPRGARDIRRLFASSPPLIDPIKNVLTGAGNVTGIS
jgi:hypothetical protein